MRYKTNREDSLNHVPAITCGIDMEPYIFEQVRDYFQQVENQVVTECGLSIHPERNFLAASPDGLIGDNTVLEIKCPYSIINQDDQLPSYLTYNRLTGLYDLDKKHNYYYQIQGEMMCSQREYAVLAVYHKRTQGDKIYLSCIDYDHNFCLQMTKTLCDFYSCFINQSE